MTKEKTKTNQTKGKKNVKRPVGPVRQGPLAQNEEPDLLALQRAVANWDIASPADILAIQRSCGNRAVQRLLAQRQGADEKGFALDDETAGRTNQARGGGKSLDGAMGRAGPYVWEHDEAETDGVREQRNATSFTTSRAIFLGCGDAQGASGDRQLMAKEKDSAANQDHGRAGQGRGTRAAAAGGGVAGIVQRAHELRTGGTPVEDGSIVICRNPSLWGRTAVVKGGQAEVPEGALTHAGIVAGGGKKVIESLGRGVQMNSVDYMRKGPIRVTVAGPSPASVLRAASGGIGKGRYALRRALDAIKKGELDREISRLSTMAGKPPKLKEYIAELREQRAQLVEGATSAELKEGIGTTMAPSADTYCVEFVVKAVEAAYLNQGMESNAANWRKRMSPLPHVGDLMTLLGGWEKATCEKVEATARGSGTR